MPCLPVATQIYILIMVGDELDSCLIQSAAEVFAFGGGSCQLRPIKE